MTMVKTDLEDKLFTAISVAFKLDEQEDGDIKDSTEEVYRTLAVELSTAIDDYIRTATVTVTTDKEALVSVESTESTTANLIFTPRSAITVIGFDEVPNRLDDFVKANPTPYVELTGGGIDGVSEIIKSTGELT